MTTGTYVVLCGGNAAGKTTLLQSVEADYGHRNDIRFVYADVEGDFKERADKQYKAVVESWLGPERIIIADGTRIYSKVLIAYQNLVVTRRLVFVILVQSPEVMKAHLIARCAKRNKKFRDEYWDRDKCYYEGTLRYTNSVNKFLREVPGYPLETYIFDVDVDFHIMPTIQKRLIDLINETCG